jgi:pimeloyl-ACP methyl ester carboxylesterase
VVGSEDQATSPTMARELQAVLKNSRLIELDGIAHAPQLQDPARFLDAIDGFL